MNSCFDQSCLQICAHKFFIYWFSSCSSDLVGLVVGIMKSFFSAGLLILLVLFMTCEEEISFATSTSSEEDLYLNQK